MRKYSLNNSHCRDETTLFLCPRILSKLLLKLGFLGCLSGFSILFFTSKAPAQQSNIIPDNTLGAESSRINRNMNVNGINADTIDKGARRGGNLFHSFSQFNINDGQNVYFTNPAGVENILTRVTGGNASNIFGTLGVDGSANLFLINPSGIVFGENAKLDVQGSFVGTTANGVQFGEQGRFSASNPEAPGLLTVNPSALFFNQITASGGIINKSQASAGITPDGNQTTGLRVPDGKSLLLVGGNINLDGGRLRAYEGSIELASVARPGNIGLDISGDTFSLNVPDNVERGDIVIANESFISVFGAVGGNFVINARNLEISNSAIFAGTAQQVGNPDAQSGDVILNATGSILLKDGAFIDNSVYSQGNAGDIFLQASNSVSLVNSNIYNNIEAGGVGKGGSINITAGSLSLTDGSEIKAVLGNADVGNNLPGGQGNLGNININVSDAVTLNGVKDGFSNDISSFVGIGAMGNAGDININADSLSLAEGSEINAKTSGKGNAGNITVNARQSISLDGSGDVILSDGSNGTLFTRIINSVDTGAVGNAGDIQLNTGTLSVTNEAFISSSSNGKGDTGNITINARDTVTFDNRSNASSSIFAGAVGNAGDIRITTGTLFLTNGSRLSTNVTGEGNAGNIFVEARDSVKLDGVQPSEFNGTSFSAVSGIESSLLTGAIGKGGDIQITTKSLSVTNGARISASTDGLGNAGNIFLNIRDTITVDGFNSSSGVPSEISTTGGSNSVGNGGDIRITTNELLFKNGGIISTFNVGDGDAGNIFLDVGNTIIFDGVGSSNLLPSSASTFAVNGNAGNIEVKTGSLFLTNGGRMSTIGFAEENSNNIANGGNIIINAGDTIKLDGANTGLETSLNRGSGKGGDIQITTGSLFVTNTASLFAITGGRGNAGNISINARDTLSFDQGGFAAAAVLSDSIGNGGDITITTNSLSVTNDSFLATTTSSQGDAGNIIIDADTTTFDKGSFASTEVRSNGIGDAGNIRIKTGTFSIANGARLISSTSGKGDGGNISINARDAVSFDQGSFAITAVASNGIGDAGRIGITTGTFSIANGAQLISSTLGKGNAGDIEINADDTITIQGENSGVFSTAESTFKGNGGEIRVVTGSLFLDDGGLLSTVTTGKGDAGNIKVDAADSVSLSDSSRIVSNVNPGGEGTGGKIDINTQTLTLTSGSGISAGVAREFANLPGGKGKGGNININASKSVNLSGISTTGSSSGIITLTGRGTSGDAGDITITTGEFRITNGAIVSATTSNDDNAGDITINANTFDVINGAQIANTTRSSGNAGTITVNVQDRVTLSGTDSNYNNRISLITEQINSSDSTDRVSDIVFVENGAASGLFASTSVDSTGEGGSIFIDPRLVTIENGARVSVSSDGTGDAGNITLQAGTLKLDNGIISAQTASTLGGNITLEIGELLLLRNGSQISTTAGTAQKGGDGGNITVNAKFIVAPANEDNNISANAFLGNGGNVLINSRGIFGIESRSQPTSKSDITASSQQGIAGETNVNTDDTSSIKNSFTELPPNIDTDAIIANSCIVRGNQQQKNSFYITGSGALPPNRPGNGFTSNYTTGEVRGVATKPRPWKKGDPIIEPQGLYRLNNGQLLLSRECSNSK